MKEGGKAVLDGDLFDDLHDHEVLVDLSGHVAEHGRELVLVRSHLFPRHAPPLHYSLALNMINN